MRRPVVRMWVWGFLATVGCGWVSGVRAFQLETHRAVNERAAVVSTLDAHLKEELGLHGGMLEVLNSIRVKDWIGIGGPAEDLFREDEVGGALYRSKHHFQNPLLPWDRAGLKGRCILPVTGQASVRWAQSEQDQTGGSARWEDARRLFLRSLTLPSKGERETAGADLFKTLGQQMHLVADLAAPAHVRNDIHCTSHSESFEIWAERSTNRDLFKTVQPIGPDPGIFKVGVPILDDQIARVPVARLWDTGNYRIATNPDLTLSGLTGLAEYTNANFFSKNTIFSSAFPFPARTSIDLDPVARIDPKTGKLRRYFTKVRDGQRLDLVAVPGALYDSLPEALKDKNIGLDDSVLAEYAAHLFPRAVGYSAALLDYFFRGKLEVTIGGDPADSEKLQLTARNASSEPLGGGTLEVYGDYADGERRPHGSWPIQGPVAPGDDLPSQSFSPDKPTPARYMVVYQGNLGEEKKDNPPGFGGAVVGKAAKYGGVLEELILFRTANNSYDVYFRNSNQVVLLGLSENLGVVSATGVAPAEVHWGVDSNHFFVKNYEKRTVSGFEIGVPVYWIYKIDRPDNSVSGDEPVQVALVKTIRPPETPLPYRYRETWVNREQWNRTGQVVYPYGTVLTAPYVGVQTVQSEQEVLSEDLGNGSGLEIYALFQARVYEEIEYVEPGGGDGWGDMGVSLIVQASTGAIVYEDPISGSYKAQPAAAVSHGHYALGRFTAWPRTWIVSWSDKDVKKRRWVTQLQADDFYLTYNWTPERGYFDDARYFVENSVQTVLVEDGRPKFSITPKRQYVEIVYDHAFATFYPAALVPTMSSEKWLWVDEPDLFTSFVPGEETDSDILRRTQYLMSTETGTRQRVGEWTPPDSPLYMMAPKIREMVMLQPGFLYAHGEPVYAIPELWGYEESSELLAQDLTTDAEKQKFVRFLAPDGRIDPAFTTAAPLMEDADFRGKGRVKAGIYPPGFQAVLDMLLNPGSNTKISWHVVPDADLVPVRRR